MARKKTEDATIKLKARIIGDLIDATGSAKDTWNPAIISDDLKAINYIRRLADTWNPAQLNEALKYLGFKTVDTWNPAELEETKNKIVKYFIPTNASGNPIELDLKGALPYEVSKLSIDLLPIQDLSQGEPSPTNICPISGRNSVEVKRTGKNLLQGVETGAIDQTTGENISGSASRTINKARGSLGGNLTVSGLSTGNYRIRKFYYNNDVYVGNELTDYISATSFTVTLPSNANSLRLQADPNKFTDSVQIELGSTATTYEPYQGEIKEITLPQTVYGGTVNVLEGGTSSTYGYIASYNGEELPGAWISDRDVYAAGTTPTTGAEVVYVLATPTELTTSAEEVTLINGENTLSTDGDTINITYKAILNS